MHKLITFTTLATCSHLLQGCQEPQASEAHNLPALLAVLEEKTNSNMVFIEGGSFTMGDFGLRVMMEFGGPIFRQLSRKIKLTRLRFPAIP